MTQPGGNFVSATIRRGLFTRVVGRRVLYYPVLGSTMDEAAHLAREGALDGTVVVAEVQERGGDVSGEIGCHLAGTFTCP